MLGAMGRGPSDGKALRLEPAQVDPWTCVRKSQLRREGASHEVHFTVPHNRDSPGAYPTVLGPIYLLDTKT
jgi:hypothetical protein